MESQFTPDRRRSHRDRRAAPRSADSGALEIWLAAPAPVTVHAELVESSDFGFRAAHDSTTLEPGLEVRFKRGAVTGQARVVWTQVLNGRRVSGFVLN